MKTRYVIKFLLTILIMTLFTVTGFRYPAYSQENRPKVIIFVLDHLSWEDITTDKTPNIKNIIDNSGLALMNVRSKNIYKAQNIESSYLSMNMGIRVNAPDNSGQVIVKNHSMQIKGFEEIKEEITKAAPTGKVGLFGTVARSKGLNVGLVSFNNGSQTTQPTALIAMDDKGKIPFTNIIQGGLGKDINFNLNEIKKITNQTDISFIDLSVAEYNQVNLSKIDSIIGAIKRDLDNKNTMLMAITPNPSHKMIKQFDFSLTPLFIDFGNEVKGLATSNTTKRAGLVTNLDFAPTIFSYFKLNTTDFIGEPLKIKVVNNPVKKVLDFQNMTLGLNRIAYIFHGIYVVLSLIIFTLLYSKNGKNNANKIWIKTASISLILFPLTSVLLPLLLGDLIYRMSWWVYLISILFTTIVPSYYIGQTQRIDMVNKLGIIMALTTILYLVESFTGFGHLLNSPFGYNDLIIGGRFYGINNNALGLFIGASVLSYFIWQERFKPSMWLVLGVAAILFGMLIISLGSVYGANVGGSILAISITFFIFIILLSKELTIKRFILTILIVFLIQVGLAFIDASYNPPLTHAGKALQTVLNNGWVGFTEILKSKVYQVFLLLIIPPWNILLFYQVYLLFKHRSSFQREQKVKPRLHKGYIIVILGSIVAFSFKDTGVIAAALMLIYLLITLAYSEKETEG